MLEQGAERSTSTAADRLIRQKPRVVALWRERIAASDDGAPPAGRSGLGDVLPELLDVVAAALHRASSPAHRGVELDEIPVRHGEGEAQPEDDVLPRVFAEYRALREVVFAVLEEDAALSPAERDAVLAAIDDGTAAAAARVAARARGRDDADREKLRLVLEAVTEHGIVMLDPEGRVVGWNAGAANIMGYAEEEILGQSAALLFTPEDREAGQPEREMRSALRDGSALDERWHVRKDGSLFYAMGVMYPLRSRDGRHLGFVKVLRDRSEEKTTQEELEVRVRRRTEEVWRQRAFVSAVLDSLEDGIVACDAEGRLTLFNRATRELHGLPERPLSAELWAEHYDIYVADGKTRATRDDIPLYRALVDGKVEDARIVVAPKGGARRVLSATGRAIFDAEGKKVGAVVAMHDITAGERAQEERIARRAAEESRERVAAILESITDAFFALDRAWRFTYVNGRSADLLGRSPEDLLGKSVWEMFPEAVGSIFEQQYRRAMDEQVAVAFESRFDPLDTWFEVHAYPSKEGLSVYFRDVNERKRTEQEQARLHEEERRLREEAQRRAAELDVIIESMPDQVFIGNTKTFVRVNGPVLRIMGFDSLEDITSDLSRFPERAQIRDARTGEPLHFRDSPFSHALRGESVVRELTHVHLKTGEKRTFVAKATPIRVDGVITGAVAVHIDVTEQRAAEEALERSEAHFRTLAEKLQAEAALRERFVATLSHDLRNPLTAAKINAQLLLRQEGLRSFARPLSKIMDNMDRIDSMIQDLLDVNRIRAGEPLNVEVERCDLAHVALEAIETLATIHGNRFVLASDAPVEGFWDRRGLGRVVENLASNAAKYGSPGRPVTIGLVEEDDLVRLRVHNEGEPLDPSTAGSLFSLFRRGDGADGQAKGWGIGLALVKAMVEAHGGSIHVESAADAGTTFVVTLPRDARAASRRASTGA